MADEVKPKELPLPVRLFLDVIFLRSTPITAVIWGTFLLATIGNLALADGLLERYGLPGFVRVSDEQTQSKAWDARMTKLDQEQQQRVKTVNDKIDWQLKLTVTRELRDTVAALCKSKDGAQRQSLQAYIDQLMEEYRLITNKDAAQPPCPPK